MIIKFQSPELAELFVGRTIARIEPRPDCMTSYFQPNAQAVTKIQITFTDGYSLGIESYLAQYEIEKGSGRYKFRPYLVGVPQDNGKYLFTEDIRRRLAKRIIRIKEEDKMANWDAAKHKVLAKKVVNVSDTTKVIIERYSYDNGPVRISVKKKITKKKGDPVYMPFGGGLESELTIKVAKLMLKLAKEE
jgi:hypothetical protein